MSSRKKTAKWVWIVSGPSGSGKTTLCESVLKEGFWKKRLTRCVTYTTRPLRPGEKDGRDYHLVSKEVFLALKKKKAFFETQKIFGFYYGTPKKAIAQARRAGKEPFLCVDVKGAQNIKRAIGRDAVTIFILAPEARALTERLKRRSTESQEDLLRRSERVKMEVSYAGKYDYVVVNDEVKDALKKMKAILLAKRCEGKYVLHSIGKPY